MMDCVLTSCHKVYLGTDLESFFKNYFLFLIVYVHVKIKVCDWHLLDNNFVCLHLKTYFEVIELSETYYR